MEDLSTDWQNTWLIRIILEHFITNFTKKQIFIFLYDLQINKCALIYSKCVFNQGDMHVSNNN